MDIIQILTVISKEASGPAYSVPKLCEAIQRTGANIQLYTLTSFFRTTSLIDVKCFVQDKFLPKSLESSVSMYRQLKMDAKRVSIFHSNSIWTMPTFYPEFARANTNAKFVIMPRGTMSEYALKRSSLKKQISLMIGQKRALKNADMFIATCQSEYEDIRNFGLSQPVAIIPNGIDIPTLKSKRIFLKRMVFLSRIDPKKRVESLINVWSEIESKFPEWTLSIVGPIDDYAKKMIALSKSKQCKRLIFEGELNGIDKFEFLANSACFVLPTFSENFGIAVAEALASGIPAITTKGAPWEGLVSHNAGWWIDISDEALKDAMQEAMSTEVEELWCMGENGKKWMQDEFSWNEIGEKCMNAYRWLLGEIDKPDYIYLD